MLEEGYTVVGLTRGHDANSLANLKYLGILDKIIIQEANLLDLPNINSLIKKYRPTEIYNLAALSSVGLSFAQPLETISFNILSVINLLEAIRSTDTNIRFYQASSSDMFGNIDALPVTEASVIHPTSPYGISKAAAHWTTVNYRESYNLFACCGVLFNHESYLRGESYFVKKVIQTALAIKNGMKHELRVGNIDLRRDFGYAPDYVKAMWKMLQKDKPHDYLVCSGESISLREIIYYVLDTLGIDKKLIVVDQTLFRPNDIKNIYGDNAKAKESLGWKYNRTFYEVLDMLIAEEARNLK